MSAVLWPLFIDVRVRARTTDTRRVHIWFPFFVLWPLLLLLVGFVLLVQRCSSIWRWRRPARATTTTPCS